MKFTAAFSLVAAVLCAVDLGAALPSSSARSYDHNITHNFESLGDLVYKRQGPNTPELRILPLGASVVFGADESHGNGFRKYLRDQLRFRGFLVNMVGTKQSGNMVDRNVEASPGDVIDQIKIAARRSTPFKPNVVLINAGTNDANKNLQDGAGERMEAMLNEMWNSESMSSTVMLLSSVLPRSDQNAERNRLNINNQYIALVARLQSQDGIHPNDNGFKIMAKWWWVAIEYASRDNLIKAAPPFSGVTGNTCEKVAGQATYGGITQKGSGNGDGIYYHNSIEMGSIWSYTSEFDRDQWFFTRLYGQQYDDIVGWWYQNEVLSWATWKNTGNGKFAKVADMDTKLFCNPRGVFWVDINADGFDDFLCVSPNGDTWASINNADGTSTTPPTFTNIGLIKSNEGFLQDRVRWGDIDGDGRADYLVIDDGGNILAWRNSGTTNKPSWQYLGMRFTAKGMGDMKGVRFEDINGDGRDDWLWVGENGATTIWTNSRSCKRGKAGDGLNVAWRQGFWHGSSSGPTHAGVGGTSNRNRIHFARIYGEAPFGLLGRADYVFMDVAKQADGRFKFDMKVWKNTGGGGSKLEADGNKYCNMHGHADGREDYVWTFSTGKMTVWPNLGKKSVAENEVFWNTPKDLFDPKALIGKDLDRRDLHLVDWNGDGACDIVWTDPDNNNRVSVWLNSYKTTGTFTWTYLANPSPGLMCAEKRGVGIHDLAVRFADVSGNGLGDYLCIEPDGRISGWVHETNGAWTRINQFKKAEGIDRANIRFANVNGQGGADMIWIDKYTGDATVYINQGKMDTGGSNWWFLKKGKQYTGSWAGTCQYFPDFDGDGRADLHSIMNVYTNRGETFFNRCGLLDYTGDDAGWAPGQDPGFGPLPNNPALPQPTPTNPSPTPIPETTTEPRPTPFVPKSLPQRAPRSDLRYQPAIDFDTEACYNVAVIGLDGELAQGMPTKGIWPAAKDCREAWMLSRQNVYSRQRCNNGYCVYLYAYYFTKDTKGTSAIDAAGHTHDWEHVAVWVDNETEKVFAVGASAHGHYDVRLVNNNNPATQIVWDDQAQERARIVYHKDGAETHAFRHAFTTDDEAENAWEAWIRAPLVGHFGWPEATATLDLRKKVHDADFGEASLGLRDGGAFNSEVQRALPRYRPGLGKPDELHPFFYDFDNTYDQEGTNII